MAFRYGPIVLARDENKEPDFFCQAPQTDETLSYDMLPPQQGEMVRLLLRQKPGMTPLLLTDYASCGKRWNQIKCRVTVWMRNQPL